MADTIYDVSFDALLLSQVLSVDIQSNVGLYKGRVSGGLDPDFIAVNKAEPRVQFKTGDLATLLGGIDLTTGLRVGGNGGAAFPFNERDGGGTFSDGAATILSSTRGFAHITSIDAQQDSEEGAVAMVEFIPTWDASTKPIESTNEETLSAESFVSCFALGPSKIGATTIAGIIGASVKPGLGLLLKQYQGAVFVGQVFINLRDPQFVFTFEDMASVNAFGAMYGAIGSTATQFFRKRVDGGTYVANGTGQHISFTLSGGISVTDSISGNGQDNTQKQITVHGKTLSKSTTATIS